MGEALEKFVAEAQGLYANFESTTLFSIGGWNISQYTLYMFIALALVLLAVLIGARKLEFSAQEVHGLFSNMATTSSPTALVQMLSAKATRSTFPSWLRCSSSSCSLT